jgi:hypothetical protein
MTLPRSILVVGWLACVGGGSNVPLGFVSLTENLMMVAMALWMLAGARGFSPAQQIHGMQMGHAVGITMEEAHKAEKRKLLWSGRMDFEKV